MSIGIFGKNSNGSYIDLFNQWAHDPEELCLDTIPYYIEGDVYTEFLKNPFNPFLYIDYLPGFHIWDSEGKTINEDVETQTGKYTCNTGYRGLWAYSDVYPNNWRSYLSSENLYTRYDNGGHRLWYNADGIATWDRVYSFNTLSGIKAGYIPRLDKGPFCILGAAGTYDIYRDDNYLIIKSRALNNLTIFTSKDFWDGKVPAKIFTMVQGGGGGGSGGYTDATEDIANFNYSGGIGGGAGSFIASIIDLVDFGYKSNITFLASEYNLESSILLKNAVHLVATVGAGGAGGVAASSSTARAGKNGSSSNIIRYISLNGTRTVLSASGGWGGLSSTDPTSTAYGQPTRCYELPGRYINNSNTDLFSYNSTIEPYDIFCAALSNSQEKSFIIDSGTGVNIMIPASLYTTDAVVYSLAKGVQPDTGITTDLSGYSAPPVLLHTLNFRDLDLGSLCGENPTTTFSIIDQNKNISYQSGRQQSYLQQNYSDILKNKTTSITINGKFKEAGNNTIANYISYQETEDYSSVIKTLFSKQAGAGYEYQNYLTVSNSFGTGTGNVGRIFATSMGGGASLLGNGGNGRSIQENYISEVLNNKTYTLDGTAENIWISSNLTMNSDISEFTTTPQYGGGGGGGLPKMIIAYKKYTTKVNFPNTTTVWDKISTEKAFNATSGQKGADGAIFFYY